MKNAIALLGMALLPCVFASSVHAEGLGTATVTTVKNRVLISQAGGKARRAVVKSTLRSSAKITTGKNAHVEVRFSDRSLVRLGSNSIFSFDPKKRKMHLERGIALIHTPRHPGGSRISTPLATAVIHDDVVAVRSLGKNGVTEFIHLSPESEGGPMMVTDRRTNEALEMGAGQLLRVRPFEPRLRKPVDISVAMFVRTSALFGQKDRAAMRHGSPSWRAITAAGNTGSSTSGTGGTQTADSGTGQPPNGSGTTSGSTSTEETTGSGTGTNPTTDTETSGSSEHDITVETGNTPVAGGTTVTADTPVTDDNTANVTMDGSDASSGESSGHDITVEAGNVPVAGDTTVTADTPVTNEDFAELSVDAEAEIIQAEADQISQVEGGELEISTQQTQEDTTVSVSDNSGTTDLDASATVDSSATSDATPVDTGSTRTTTTTAGSDATVDSDATLLIKTQTAVRSLVSSTTTDPINSTVAAEEEDVVDDVTEEVLCTPTELGPCPDGK